MIITLFTSFTENFVIGNHQITIFPAQQAVFFFSFQADITIRVFPEVNTVVTPARFHHATPLVILGVKKMSRCLGRYRTIKFWAIVGGMWFLIAGAMIDIPIILAELPERKNCKCFFKEHHRHE